MSLTAPVNEFSMTEWFLSLFKTDKMKYKHFDISTETAFCNKPKPPQSVLKLQQHNKGLYQKIMGHQSMREKLMEKICDAESNRIQYLLEVAESRAKAAYQEQLRNEYALLFDRINTVEKELEEIRTSLEYGKSPEAALQALKSLDLEDGSLKEYLESKTIRSA